MLSAVGSQAVSLFPSSNFSVRSTQNHFYYAQKTRAVCAPFCGRASSAAEVAGSAIARPASRCKFRRLFCLGALLIIAWEERFFSLPNAAKGRLRPQVFPASAEGCSEGDSAEDGVDEPWHGARSSRSKTGLRSRACFFFPRPVDDLAIRCDHGCIPHCGMDDYCSPACRRYAAACRSSVATSESIDASSACRLAPCPEAGLNCAMSCAS